MLGILPVCVGTGSWFGDPGDIQKEVSHRDTCGKASQIMYRLDFSETLLGAALQNNTERWYLIQAL